MRDVTEQQMLFDIVVRFPAICDPLSNDTDDDNGSSLRPDDSGVHSTCYHGLFRCQFLFVFSLLELTKPQEDLKSSSTKFKILGYIRVPRRDTSSLVTVYDAVNRQGNRTVLYRNDAGANERSFVDDHACMMTTIV
jgi:hypothetical protein